MEPAAKRRIAVVSVHGCPLARLGEKDTGGMNVYIHQTSLELGARGHDVDIFTRVHDPRDPEIVHIAPNVRVVHLRAGPITEPKHSIYRRLPEFIDQLCAFRQRHRLDYDLVHAHYWLSGWVGLWLKWKWGLPLVASFHTLGEVKLRARSGEHETRLRLQTERKVMAQADRLVAETELEREQMVRLCDAPRGAIRVIPAGVNTTLFRPLDKGEARRRLGLPQDKKIVLFVGRMEPIKGIDILVQVIRGLEDKERLLALVVGGKAGDAESSRLRAQVRRLGMAPLFQFVGAVKQDELVYYYNAADVCLTPSYYESFGLVALEAMACGTPVVASRVGGLMSIVRDGETGYLVPWRCADPYVERMELLLANDGLAEALGDAGVRVAGQFQWSRVVDQLTGLYDEVLDQPVAAAAGH